MGGGGGRRRGGHGGVVGRTRVMGGMEEGRGEGGLSSSWRGVKPGFFTSVVYRSVSGVGGDFTYFIL